MKIFFFLRAYIKCRSRESLLMYTMIDVRVVCAVHGSYIIYIYIIDRVAGVKKATKRKP